MSIPAETHDEILPPSGPENDSPNHFNTAAGDDDDVLNAVEDEEEDDEEEEEEEEYEEEQTLNEPPSRGDKFKANELLRKMQSGPVPVRVHDVIVKGNSKTKDHLIEAEVDVVKYATTMQELFSAAKVANFNLQALEVFDSVNIMLEAGPSELPGTVNVIINVVETGSPLSGQIGAYTKSEAGSSSVEASLKYKNILGYGDLWDGSLVYGADHSSELSFGVYLPRFRGLVTPFTARAFLLSQDTLKFSSYKERSLGISLGLYSHKNHDLSYTLAWRTLSDPSQLASKSIRRQLGHNLLSSLKYTFKLDRRNSPLRPTRGYAFVSTTQVGGLAPDSRSLRFLRQEFDLRYAVPFGFYRAALNFGISAGVTFPWGNGFLNRASTLPERFFLGGNISPVCSLGGPAAVWGFKTRGLGPTEPRRQSNDENADPSGHDFLGGDLAVTTFADLSFDFPLRWFKEKGIHGHVFACAGNLAKLTENEYKSFTLQKAMDSFRTSVGAGIVVPTSLFRMEVNYCYILRKFDNDRAKSGFFLTFSAPS